MLNENRRMLDVFTDSGFDITQTLESGLVRVTLSLDRTDTFVERSAWAQLAASASLGHSSAPRSVAVVGASRTRQADRIEFCTT